jgi:molybdenum cofactor cytidylyltransferase
MKIKSIILAAGPSSRMGQSKQLLTIEGQSLLRRTAAAFCHADLPPMIVLGARVIEHVQEVTRMNVVVVLNNDWSKGMGNSLKFGVSELLRTEPDTDAIIISVCDQPLLTSTHLQKLVDTFKRTGKPIVASRYNNTDGVPVLFHKSCFNALRNIGDEEGAKKIVAANSQDVVSVDFPDGAIDLDTIADYEKFKQQNPAL